jgi:hypothetical protein
LARTLPIKALDERNNKPFVQRLAPAARPFVVARSSRYLFVPLPLLFLSLPLWLSSPKGICFCPLPLFVLAVTLRAAKNPDTLHATRTERTFQPVPAFPLP